MAGRTVLTALVGGLVTALSVIFSLTIAGLQTIHAQYSPRLLRNFIQDSAAKVTLATFAGSAAYMLAVLRRIPSSPSPEPVPRLAITGGLVLFLLCIGVVAYYAQHITQSMRVGSAMKRVVQDALGSAQFHDDRSVGQSDALPEPPEDALVVSASRTGYMQGADLETLAGTAAERGVTLRLRPMVGDPVVAGAPLAWVWPAPDGERDDYRSRVDEAVSITENRILDKDLTYGLRQLVDVAVRAMSPSLNHPYTAVEAIDHLTMMLCRLAEKGMGPRVRFGEDDRVLVAHNRGRTFSRACG